MNVKRLKAYKEKLIAFPRKKGADKVRLLLTSMSSNIEEEERDSQTEAEKAETILTQIPLPESYVHDAPRPITKEGREFKAYRALREGRAQARHEGKRNIRAERVRSVLRSALPSRLISIQKAEEEANKK